jgi:hypothetical protein
VNVSDIKIARVGALWARSLAVFFFVFFKKQKKQNVFQRNVPGIARSLLQRGLRRLRRVRLRTRTRAPTTCTTRTSLKARFRRLSTSPTPNWRTRRSRRCCRGAELAPSTHPQRPPAADTHHPPTVPSTASATCCSLHSNLRSPPTSITTNPLAPDSYHVPSCTFLTPCCTPRLCFAPHRCTNKSRALCNSC